MLGDMVRIFENRLGNSKEVGPLGTKGYVDIVRELMGSLVRIL